MKKLGRILVGLDLSPEGKRLSIGSSCALEEARALAVEYGAEVLLLHSTHGDEFVDPLTAHAAIVSLGGTPEGRAALDGACERLQKSGVKATLELTDQPPGAPTTIHGAPFRRTIVGEMALALAFPGS